MSRSSKGFADFFPTAPSVLQQKRSKAPQQGKEPSSPATRDSPYSKNLPSSTSSRNAENAKTSGLSSSVKASGPQRKQHTTPNDEQDIPQTDFAHEVGSASSTSTNESVFSSHQKGGKASQLNGVQNSTNLTPLTNVDSSPRTVGLHSPKKAPHDHQYGQRVSPGSPYGEAGANPSWIADSSTPRTLSQKIPQPRPGKGEAKGYKITYDPSLDRSGRKKSRDPQYEAFGMEVRSIERSPNHEEMPDSILRRKGLRRTHVAASVTTPKERPIKISARFE